MSAAHALCPRFNLGITSHHAPFIHYYWYCGLFDSESIMFISNREIDRYIDDIRSSYIKKIITKYVVENIFVFRVNRDIELMLDLTGNLDSGL